MAENLSLFGWPIAEPREKAGRPEHEPTDENRNKVMMMLVFGCENRDIAAALGISQPTLRKHYFQQLAERRRARLQLEATRRAKLFEKVLAGDVSAMKELDRQLVRHDLKQMADRVSDRGRQEPRAPKLGKKEQRQEEAGAVSGKFAPPAPPRLIN